MKFINAKNIYSQFIQFILQIITIQIRYNVKDTAEDKILLLRAFH